jgi:hypothetical protein
MQNALVPLDIALTEPTVGCTILLTSKAFDLNIKISVGEIAASAGLWFIAYGTLKDSSHRQGFHSPRRRFHLRAADLTDPWFGKCGDSRVPSAISIEFQYHKIDLSLPVHKLRDIDCCKGPGEANKGDGHFLAFAFTDCNVEPKSGYFSLDADSSQSIFGSRGLIEQDKISSLDQCHACSDLEKVDKKHISQR